MTSNNKENENITSIEGNLRASALNIVSCNHETAPNEAI